jgi:hypothetical protein
MRFVTLKYDNPNIQPGGIIHRPKRQRQVIRNACVFPINRTATSCTKDPCYLGALVRDIGECVRISADDDCGRGRGRGRGKHRTNRVTCSAQAAAFIAMALRGNDRWPVSHISHRATKAFCPIFFRHVINSKQGPILRNPRANHALRKRGT